MTVDVPMIYYADTISELTAAFGGTVPDNTICFERSTFLNYYSVSNAWNLIGPKAPVKVFSNPARSLNTIFQVSATRDAVVTYGVSIATTLSLTSGAAGTVTLKYADNAGFTANVVTLPNIANGQTGTLTIGLGLNQNVTGILTGIIPAGKYVQIVTANTTGAPTIAMSGTQEVLI